MDDPRGVDDPSSGRARFGRAGVGKHTPVLTIRRDREIYEKQGSWFHARWHFSFDEYYDPERLGVGPLRVFNDDEIIAGAAWPMHPHRDIESLTYVAGGHFEHADSLGNNGRMSTGAAQVMDFGHEGALHSERNASGDEPVRFIQFWILPSSPLQSAVQQRQFEPDERTDGWLQIMGPAGESGLDLAQDARVHVARLTPGTTVTHTFGEQRAGYVYAISGAGALDDTMVSARDAAEVTGPHALTATAGDQEYELMLVDVPQRFRPIGVWARGD